MNDTRFRLRRIKSNPVDPSQIYRVMLDGRTVGTIIEHKLPSYHVTWSVTAIVGRPPGVQNGMAASIEAAMDAWREMWEKVEAGPHGPP
ncbi:hypothetical protein SAMN02745157_1486 [Kaistia soli DSM 19436]|uniref:Uncharacterized protein n=1 Tax=Kaistia soli DSM 19436 TaxID=1122133 RepID=A0A1M4YD97_9HYPH|nr:hypothetical protein [Kaistia soli]SHF03588.1 hypothetical protein SAMN02745157_1486 [Kaistia soli DSM 19436]